MLKKHINQVIIREFSYSDYFIVYIMNSQNSSLYSQKIQEIGELIKYTKSSLKEIKLTGGLYFFIISPNYRDKFLNITYRDEILCITIE